MKRISILFTFYIISIMAFGQQNLQDIVYLKNDTIIKGIIFEQIPFKCLRIFTSDGDTLIYKIDEVEKIIREPILNERESVKSKRGLKAGYQGIVEMGVSKAYPSNQANDYTACLKLNVINGYRFNPYLFLGVGIGLRYPYLENDIYLRNNWPSPVFNDFGVPIFLDIRTNFFIHKVTPFLAFSLGYSFDMNNNNPITREKNYSFSQITGVGLLLSPSAEINYTFSDTYGINIGISYESQRFKKYSLDCPRCLLNVITSSNCLSFNIGLLF